MTKIVVVKRKDAPPSGDEVRFTLPDRDPSFLFGEILRHLAKDFNVEIGETKEVWTKIKPE